MTLPFNSSRFDRLGASVSFVCAIHCAVVPFAATLLLSLVPVLWQTKVSSITFFSYLSRWRQPVSAGESAFTGSAAFLFYLGRRCSSCLRDANLKSDRQRLRSSSLALHYSFVVIGSIIDYAGRVSGVMTE